MRATAEPVEGNKIRLSVEVDEPEFDKVLDETVRSLSRQARVPGFRPGHVPRQVLEARMGGAVALRAEALREALPDFYAKAVVETQLDPIAAPEIDITGGEEQGPLAFDAVVEVRPTVAIPGYPGLQITLPSPEVTEAEVDAQMDVVRETDAELVEVERPAVDGDHVTVDLHSDGSAGGQDVDLTDYLYEVGSGSVAPELDAQLRGAKVGDVLAVEATPAGSTGPVALRVLVKEVKEKRLPPLTDEWVAESSEFSSVTDLRENVRSRIARVKALQARMARQENALAALAALVDDEEVPEVLVEDEVRERVHSLSHRLEEQHIGLDQFLEATGRTGDELVAQVRSDAYRAVKIDLALRALADAEALEVTDEEFETELDSMAERMKVEPGALRQQLDRAGRTAAVRSEQRKAKAATWLLDHVAMVDEDGNEITAADLESEGLEQGAEGTGASAGGTADGATGDEAGSVETEGADR
jgi:trigger factor